jgi:hypothetical protein
MPRTDRSFGPLRQISFTASEILARQVVDKLYRLPPRGMSWREHAIHEIGLALRAAAQRPGSTPRNDDP